MDFNSFNIYDINLVMYIITTMGLTFLFTAAGSMTMELYKTLMVKYRRVSMLRFFISTLSSGFVALFIGEWIKGKLTPLMYFSLCYILGLLGFELFNKISSLDSLVDLVNRFRKMK